MKIVHVINYFQHKLGYQEYFLAREQVELGHDVTIVTSDRYDAFPDYDTTAGLILGERIIGKKRELIDEIKVIRLKSILEQPRRRIWLVGLKKIISSIKPDLVISHGEYTFNTLRLSRLQKRFNFKLIVDSHSILENRNIDFLKNGSRFSSLITKKIFNKFVFSNKKIIWVPVAAECGSFLSSYYGLNRNSMHIIPLGTDLNRFKADEKFKFEYRKELNIELDKIVILYTGRMVFEKDPVLIVESLENVLNELNVVIMFVGNIGDSYRERFNSFYKKFSQKILHVNAVRNSEIDKFYKIADIAVWPKGASLSMIDAMSCGLPVIVNDYLTDRISNNNGIGIREGNLDQLREAILKLVRDKGMRNIMGKNGRALVEKEFCWKNIAQKFIDLAYAKS